MKRFLRWMMAVCCIFILGIWVASTWKHFTLTYFGKNVYACTISFGRLILYRVPNAGTEIGLQYEYARSGAAIDPLGLYLPHFSTVNYRSPTASTMVQGPLVSIPFWLIFLIQLYFALLLWYYAIKAWWLGTHRKGFEVQIKSESKDHRQDADATDQSEKSL